MQLSRPKGAIWLLALILAALSEIEVQFRFGAAPDLLFVWSVCSDTFPLIKEVFESRWKQGLSPE